MTSSWGTAFDRNLTALCISNLYSYWHFTNNRLLRHSVLAMPYDEMNLSLWGAKPLPEPMPTYCRWNLTNKFQWNSDQNTNIFIQELYLKMSRTKCQTIFRGSMCQKPYAFNLACNKQCDKQSNSFDRSLNNTLTYIFFSSSADFQSPNQLTRNVWQLRPLRVV